MWPTLAGKRSGVKAVNCVHDSQGDQIGHPHSAAHHNRRTFFGGTPRQGTAHKKRIISMHCSPWLYILSITNKHTIIYHDVQSNCHMDSSKLFHSFFFFNVM